MQKYFFVLIPFLILNAKSADNTHKIYQTTGTEQITISKELIDPVVHTDIVPCIGQESHGVFIPVVYGNAGKITFSNGISFNTEVLGKGAESYLPVEMQYRQDKIREVL